MINPKLHLQAPKGSIDGEFPILLLFSVNKKRIQYYTQVRMPKKYFISAKGSKYPFNNRWPMAAAAKIKLDALIRHVYSIESDFIKSGIEQNIDLYREELDKRYKGRTEATAESTESIEDRIKEYLEHVKKNLRNNQSRYELRLIILRKEKNWPYSNLLQKLVKRKLMEEVISRNG